MAGIVRSAGISLILVLGGCAVDGGGPESGSGDDPTCTSDKCDDLGEEGRSGKRIANPCPVDLAVGVVEAGSTYEPSLVRTIPKGGSTWFPTLKGDRFVITDVGGVGWRTVAYVDGPGPVDLDPGWCPWDVFIEGGTVTEKAADGRDWDPYLVGGFRRPDPYATGWAHGQRINCQGHAIVQGSATSTAADTTTPEWNRETLSWIAWHDMSDDVYLEVIDDDVGLDGEPIGYCEITNIPTPDALPAVITHDCGNGTMTIRIEPADGDRVDTDYISPGGACS